MVEEPQIGGTGGKSPKRQFEGISLNHPKAGMPDSLQILGIMKFWLIALHFIIILVKSLSLQCELISVKRIRKQDVGNELPR